MSDQLLSGNPIHTDEDRENILRPKRLQEFQGQEDLKKNFSIFIQAAKGRNEPLDHVFLSGPPGLGKTTLAGITAHEMGGELKITSAPALDKAKDLAGILTSIKEGTIFFIDEIHRLKPALEEMLYIAMEDSEIDWVIGQGPAARNIRIPIPPFTLIGATTKSGSVSSPLYSRFGISFRIELYQEPELANIIERSAQILEISIEPKAVRQLAKCSRGTPRVANRLLRRMRDYAQVMGDGEITADIVDHGLTQLGIDALGLEKQDRKILEIIIHHYKGGPVGAETIAISMGEAVETLEDFHEPYLIQRGFLQRTPRGRVATDLAYTHLGLEPPLEELQKQEAAHAESGLLF